MRRILRGLVILGLMFMLAACATTLVGQPAPDFRLLDANDRMVALSELRGQKNAVVFYVSHT
jgi:hypothetical protein